MARFVGAMNELPGTVRALGGVEVGGVVVVERGDGFLAGSTVTVLVRPEDVRFRPDPGHGLRAQVVSRTFQGAATMVSARLEDVGVVVRSFVPGVEASSLKPGTPVAVELDGGRALCEARS